MDDKPKHNFALGSRRTAKDLAYERLRQIIIDGALLPDQRVTELSLADHLQISRTPLRQALQHLESEGWIRRTSTGAIRIGGVSENDIDDLYTVRSSLEVQALRQASLNAVEQDLVSVRAILAEQAQAIEADDLSSAADIGERFHHFIWELSRNHICIEFLEIIYDRTKRYRRLAFDQHSNTRQGAVEHAKIFDFFAGGDINSAERCLIEHIAQSRKIVRAAFQQWSENEENSAPVSK